MGESKQRQIDRAALELTKELTEKGQLIEGGFAAFAHIMIPQGASPGQLQDMRFAFMAGAEHVWSSMLSLLDEDADPTEDDMRRMGLIQKELDAWRAIFAKRTHPTRGNG